MSADRPSWTPRTSRTSGATCQNCDSQVSKQFARVLGDNQDVAHACPGCTDNRDLPREASNAGGGLR